MQKIYAKGIQELAQLYMDDDPLGTVQEIEISPYW